MGALTSGWQSLHILYSISPRVLGSGVWKTQTPHRNATQAGSEPLTTLRFFTTLTWACKP